MRSIILLLAITLMSCNTFAPELLTFLELQDSTINVKTCEGNYPFSITRTAVDPKQMERGTPMKLLLLGSSTIDVTENKIRFRSFLDGNLLQTDFEDRKGHVIQKGKTEKITITRDTPDVIPSGSWKIIIEELDASENVNWCINVTFDI
jgi:hypothetical protein